MWQLVLLGFAAAVVLGEWAVSRWRYRKLPGPFSLPLIGNLVPMMTKGLHVYLHECRLKYGKVFKVYLGANPFIVVADPELARRVNARHVERMFGPQLTADRSGRDDTALLGLAAANGEEWRALRLAWQPAFQSGSLARYASLMDACARRLSGQLAAAAAEGKQVDLWRALGTMTMGVVGSTAFGIDLHTMDDEGSPHRAEGERLLAASGTVFSSASILRGSLWQPFMLMLPKFAPAIKWLAARLPDARLIELTQARRDVFAVSEKLIDAWRAQHGVSGGGKAEAAGKEACKEGEEAAPAPTLEELQGDAPGLLAGATVGAAAANGDVAPARARDQLANGGGAPAPAPKAAKLAAADKAGDADNNEDDDDAAKRARAGLGIEPGSFLDLLLGARQKAADGVSSRFSDAVVAAQANTFILAGYETTANTLAYALYSVAREPRVRARLQAEVDAFGPPDKPITHDDLGSFPYAEAVVKEALRLYPPAIMTSRKVVKDLELQPGVVVKKGIPVFTCLYAYQRDPEYWPRALEFLPERFLPEGASALGPTTENAWTPFGAGPRMCIGWRFALNEAKIALLRLHQRLEYELAPGQVPLKLRLGITLSPAEGVIVTPKLRAAPAAPAAA